MLWFKKKSKDPFDGEKIHRKIYNKTKTINKKVNNGGICLEAPNNNDFRSECNEFKQCGPVYVEDGIVINSIDNDVKNKIKLHLRQMGANAIDLTKNEKYPDNDLVKLKEPKEEQWVKIGSIGSMSSGDMYSFEMPQTTNKVKE